MGSEDTRKTVADRAGLSAIHGGSERTLSKWQGRCDAPGETHLVFTVERAVEAEVADKETHLPIECPICGDEHLLERLSD